MRAALLDWKFSVLVAMAGRPDLCWRWIPALLLVTILVGTAPVRADEPPEAPQANEDIIVMLGDSLTFGAPWRKMFPGLDVRNQGVPGDISRGVAGRIHEATDLHPGKIFIMIGTNELGHDHWKRDFVHNYRRSLKDIRRLSPGTEIYILSLLPRKKLGDRVPEANEALKKLADHFDCTYLDLYSAFQDAGGYSNKELYRPDYLHLKAGGYEVWRREIADCVTGQC